MLACSCAGSGAEQGVAIPVEVTRAEREQLALTLEPLGSCEDAAASLRQALEADVNARMDEALRSYLTSDPARCERSQRDEEPEPSYDWPARLAAADEADTVKTDRAYLYVLDSGGLRVLALQPAEQTRQVAQVAVPGTPTKLLVAGDRALVYSTIAGTDASCKGCVAGSYTALLLYDLGDRTAPRLLRRVDVRGDLQTARQIGQRVYSVISAAPIELGLKYAPSQFDPCFPATPRPTDKDAVEAFEQLRAQNLANVRALDFAPVAVLARDAGACKLYRAGDRGTGLTSLVGIDLSLDAAPSVTSLQSQRGQAYVSDQGLYVAVDQAHTLHAHDSAVHALRWTPDRADADYFASALVSGRVMDAASMDELHDQLRIATTTDFSTRHPDARNFVTVLSLRDGRLQQVGQLAGLLPGQDVRSVQFEGEHAFLNTLHPPDPLYVLDLKDPAHPSLLGALEHTGYSLYRRMIDDRHLLTVGYYNDATGQDLAYFNGVVLQIADMADLHAPGPRYQLHFELPADSTGANWHAKTIAYGDNRLALPISLCVQGPQGLQARHPFDPTFSGVIVYDVDPEAGITELGRVASVPASPQDAADLCDNWYSRASTDVERSLLLDDHVYAFTATSLHVQDLRALGTDVATVAMGRL